eukprot:2363573-Rhodomonas_salina.1
MGVRDQWFAASKAAVLRRAARFGSLWSGKTSLGNGALVLGDSGPSRLAGSQECLGWTRFAKCAACWNEVLYCFLATSVVWLASMGLALPLHLSSLPWLLSLSP